MRVKVAQSCPGDLPDPGIEPGSPALQADSSPAELPGKLWCYAECARRRNHQGNKGSESRTQIRRSVEAES